MPLFDLRTAWMRLHNQVDYPLRQLFRWRRDGFRTRGGEGQDLFGGLKASERARAEKLAARYRAEYHLDTLVNTSRPRDYRENLFYLDMLVRALDELKPHLPDDLTAADIGPSSWFYVQALHAGLKWWGCPAGRSVTLTGFEADAFRVFTDLHSRYDHAMGHLRGLQGAAYQTRAFSAQPAHYDLITLFFPFVFEKDHLEWGLPGGMFAPQRLLDAAWASLKPGGCLVVVNQGEDEHRAERALFERAGIPIACAIHQEALLFRYDLDRYVLGACRTGAHRD